MANPSQLTFELVTPDHGVVSELVDEVQLPGAEGYLGILPGHIPPDGATITAGFHFDVPVRFDTDTLDIDLAAFEAGEIPSIPLIEIRP